ncbi:MAG: DNA polymerase III subunit beta [Patescibacteria group bacterium]
MYFACTRENLMQSLSVVGHITSKNINLPVLNNVLLKTEAGSLKLSTTNLEIAVNCLLRGKIETDGEYSVPAKLFLDFVSLLPSGKVELVLKDDGLEIKSEEQETVLRGMPASEFPLLPKININGSYKLKVTDLKHAIDQVVFAVSNSESRPELSGIACFFSKDDGKDRVLFAATDSYRLAEKCLSYSEGKGEAKFIVPARALLEISRILGSYKDELGIPDNVTLSFAENQMVMTFGGVELITRLIEGSFPDYQQIIPQAFKTEALITRIDFQKAVRAASLFSKQGLFDIQLTLDPANNTCTVASADQGTGKTKTILKGEVIGVENTVTLNYRYLSDGLAAMSCEKIRIKQIDSMSPVLVLPDSATEEYKYVVMPIRQ